MKLGNDVDSDLNPDGSRIFLSWLDDLEQEYYYTILPDPEQPELTLCPRKSTFWHFLKPENLSISYKNLSFNIRYTSQENV
jgi:hypothetical protein